MNPIRTALGRTHLVGCGWFWVWALVGCAAALAVVSLGPLLLLPAVLLGAWMASRPAIRGSSAGLLTGAGMLFLFVAYVNRQGPGTLCWQHGTASGCDTYLNPLPWLVIGVAMVLAGIVVQARRA